MTQNRLMLDSGAYTVWTKGDSIDLEEYIAFCRKHPDTSYYVNLDVIPGEKGQKRFKWKPKGLLPQRVLPEVETACKKSWDNYLRMTKILPAKKVLPVFHQNEDFKWLEKYLDHGVKYIGISPENDRTALEKFQWLREVEKITVANGKPIVHMHGFGIASFRLLTQWPYWYSVDSTNWLRAAVLGLLYVPKKVKGEFD